MRLTKAFAFTVTVNAQSYFIALHNCELAFTTLRLFGCYQTSSERSKPLCVSSYRMEEIKKAK